jgi:hypothetical protein
VPRPSALSRYGKAIGSGVGHALVYLIGVMTAEDGFGDLATVQWLGVALAFLAGAGVVAVIPKGDEVLRLGADGQLRAGPAATRDTGVPVRASTPVSALVQSPIVMNQED